VIAKTPLSTGSDLDAAVAAATKAFPEWSETPPVIRARAMFKFRQLLDDHFEEIARIVTTEHGKTLDEARGSVRRGIECVEVACGAPSLLMGYGLENVAPGLDCQVMRQPVGVCAVIAPFKLPGDGAALVPAVRGRVRQHVHPETVGAGTALAAAHLRVAREMRSAARRRESGPRRP
jgi:acyl-CoA reductase-like NAD-dependent aldehyde dehydrogenase